MGSFVVLLLAVAACLVGKIECQDCSSGECPMFVSHGSYTCTPSIGPDCCGKALLTFRAFLALGDTDYLDTPPEVERGGVVIAEAGFGNVSQANSNVRFPICRPGFGLIPFGLGANPTTPFCYSSARAFGHMGFETLSDCMGLSVEVLDLDEYLADGITNDNTRNRNWANHVGHCMSYFNDVISSCLSNYIELTVY